METTQKDMNEYINMEQFKSISWSRGLPALIIEILAYITGETDETIHYFE